MKHWTLDDIHWDKFDASKVDADILAFAKAASVVEHNGKIYEQYLLPIFEGDKDMQDAIIKWADEEVQHGRVLAKWSEMADPEFNFEASFKKFNDGYQIPLDLEESVRGSRCGELVARCIVETGTSSFYTAVTESTEEPALKQIAKHIAADEFRHYKLFYNAMKKYLEIDNIGFLKRLQIVLGRIQETEDDELAYAYFATNPITPNYDLKFYSKQILSAYKIYQRHHLERAVSMVFKAIGLSGQSRLLPYATNFAWWMARRKFKAA